MKKIYLLLISFCLIIPLKAQVFKTVEVTSGNLNSILTEEEKNTITHLTLIGTVDARDFITTTIMPLLTELDLSQAKVTAIDTVVDDRIAISREDTIGGYDYYPSAASSPFSPRLTSLKLPSTLKAIDSSGLKQCSGLTSLEIPSTVTYIGIYAFADCTGLTSINIPSSVTHIEMYAFYLCTGLKELTISASVGGIRRFTFSGCTGLEKITINSPIAYIDEFAFNLCTPLTTLILPESLNGFEFGAFFNCLNIKSIYSYNPIPPTGAGGAFFAEAYNGTVYVPYGSGSLYAAAEGWKDFKNIVEELPGFSLSDTIIYFDIIEQSKTVKVNSKTAWTASSDQSWLSISPASGNSSGMLTLTAEANATSSYRFATITVTPAEGEPKMIKVTQKSFPIVIPLIAGNLDRLLTKEEQDTITSLTLTGTINAKDIETIDAGFPLLTYLDLSSTKLTSTSIDNDYYPDNWFPGPGTTKYQENIGGLGNVLLSTLKLPSTVEVIGSSAFSYSGISTLTIPPSVKIIGWSAFAFCRSLETITIPSSVKEIDQSLFDGCIDLKEAIIEAPLYAIPRSTFSNCNKMTSLKLPSTVRTLQMFAFAGCVSLPTINLPDSVANIEIGAFSGCTGLRTIYSNNPTPPFLERNNFEEVAATCTLYVPYGSASRYATAYRWKDFKNIVEILPFTLSASELSIEAVPIVQSIQITSDRTWSAMCDKEWLTLNPASGDSSQTVTFTCQQNMAFEPRTASVVFSDGNGYSQTVIVTQEARINNIPIASAGPDQFVLEGELVKLDGSASSDADGDTLTYYWSVPEEITLNTENDAHPSFTAPKVEKDIIYTFYLVVNDGKENSSPDPVLIAVQNKIIELGIPDDSIVFESKESITKIYITGNARWNISENVDWLTVSPIAGEGQKEIKITALANELQTERIAHLTISAPDVDIKTITVIQRGLTTAIDKIANAIKITCFPNPFTHNMIVEVANPLHKEISVDIFTISGKKITSLIRAQKEVKINCLWDGKDESGKQVPTGIYLLKVNGEMRKVVRK